MAEEDIIFGKNRHFYGGMEPSSMVEVAATYDSSHPVLTYTIPSDTIIDGQIMCNVSGVEIRRKADGYPTDEFDGTLVATVTSSGSITDSSVVGTGTYYYKFFPYSDQGVYNRSSSNQVAYNEPAAMTSFKAQNYYDKTNSKYRVQLTVTLPSGVSGVIIRKSLTSYPESTSDGTAVTTMTSSGTYYDTSVTNGTVVHYTAFPYTSSTVYSRSKANRAEVLVGKNWVFGYDLAVTDSAPGTRVTYPSDVDNASFTAAAMGSSTFSYGGWAFSPGEYFMPRPCMLKSDGTVDYYLNPNDYSKKEDGTDSDIANTSYDGNAMIEWPKIYVKRSESNNVYSFRCSDSKLDSSYECWSNYNQNDEEIDHFYTPAYLGSVVSSKMRSLSGQTPTHLNTATQEINYAKANGDAWYTEVVADYWLIQDLLVMMAKSTDGQTAYGYGNVNDSRNTTGTLNAKGMFWGSTSSKAYGVKVFGMEDWWGNECRRIAGWMTNSAYVQLVKLTRGTHDGSTATDYNTTGSGYINSGVSLLRSAYISKCTTKSYGRLPSAVSGSSSTYECDYGLFSSSGYARVGGYWYNDLNAGPFYVGLNNSASDTDGYIGVSLSCKK